MRPKNCLSDSLPDDPLSRFIKPCIKSPVEMWWHTVTHGRGSEGEINAVDSQYPSHYLRTWCIQHNYRWCAHLGCQQSTEPTPPRRFKFTRPFRRKTKSGFFACAITVYNLQSTVYTLLCVFWFFYHIWLLSAPTWIMKNDLKIRDPQTRGPSRRRAQKLPHNRCATSRF